MPNNLSNAAGRNATLSIGASLAKSGTQVCIGNAPALANAAKSKQKNAIYESVPPPTSETLVVNRFPEKMFVGFASKIKPRISKTSELPIMRNAFFELSAEILPFNNPKR